MIAMDLYLNPPPAPGDDEPELLTPDEAAAYLRCQQTWLRRHPEVPRLPSGMYRRSDLLAYVASVRVVAASGEQGS